MRHLVFPVLVAAVMIVAAPVAAQVTPTIKTADPLTIELPSRIAGGAALLLDTSGHAIGTAANPLVVSCIAGCGAGFMAQAPNTELLAQLAATLEDLSEMRQQRDEALSLLAAERWPGNGGVQVARLAAD